MDRQGNLRKELPFTVGLPVSLMNADTQAEDTVVVQGIIDIIRRGRREFVAH